MTRPTMLIVVLLVGTACVPPPRVHYTATVQAPPPMWER